MAPTAEGACPAQAEQTLSPRWMDLAEVCMETRLSRRTISTERNAGRFPTPLVFGRRVVFPRREVLDFMKRREDARAQRERSREAEMA